MSPRWESSWLNPETGEKTYGILCDCGHRFETKKRSGNIECPRCKTLITPEAVREEYSQRKVSGEHWRITGTIDNEELALYTLAKSEQAALERAATIMMPHIARGSTVDIEKAERCTVMEALAAHIKAHTRRKPDA